MALAQVMLRLPDAEKELLEAEAAAEGISVSLLVYRRLFDKPDASRKAGRQPKHDRNQPEGLFDVA